MSRNPSPCLVPVSHANGMDLNAQLVLDQKPIRQQQKLRTLTKYIQSYPSGWKKRFELAKLLYQIGQWQQAIDELSYVVRRQPQVIEARLLLGHLWHLTGKEKNAICLYEQTLAWVQDDATRYHITGLIAQCQRRWQTALDSFESAVLKHPDNSVHWLLLGQIQLRLEKPLAAQRSFDRVLSLKPNDVTALIYSYDALLQLHQVKTAEQRLQQAYKNAPSDFRVLLRLASRRCQQHLVLDDERAATLELIRTVLRLAPQSAEAHHLLACCHVFQGERIAGEAVMQRFVEQYPNHPYGWYFYARLLFQLGQVQKAADTIMHCYQKQECDREIYRACCEILPAAGRLKLLQPMLLEMVAAFPMSWSLWVTVGRVWVEKFNNYELGIAHSTRATELAQDQAAAWFAHGRVLMLAEHYAQAIEALEQGYSLGNAGARLQTIAAGWLEECDRHI
ncbi:tetratricopeptide repeat protein [Oscillatoria sp. CS-180]|uniref:tetratricopeptide repeat protein n=1 Tax=Oscillatoria sp. CS-180 TaxID=3021720 RepID=UPI00232D60BA|nr:tetratricopeptide repeat protein [Oscillatoria sp. CS-180]MDB9529660.1 tetratricopeptide repeat protein [Oscillatoria sp. CS-180]